MNQEKLIEIPGEPVGRSKQLMALADYLYRHWDMPTRRSAQRFADLLDDHWDQIKKYMGEQ